MPHPATINHSFLRHLVFWCLFLPSLMLVMVPLVWPNQSLDPAEVAMVSRWLDDVDAVTQAANDHFTSWFDDTHLIAITRSFLHPAKPASPLWDVRPDWSADWIDAFWAMLYRAIWRWMALKSMLLAPVLVLASAALIDGFTVRARKTYRFEAAHPGLYYAAMHGVMLILGMTCFLPLAPLVLTPWMLGAMVATITVALWLLAANR